MLLLLEVTANHHMNMNAVGSFLSEFVCDKTIPTVTTAGHWLIVDSPFQKKQLNKRKIKESTANQVWQILNV